jgi:hypothetical protein
VIIILLLPEGGGGILFYLCEKIFEKVYDVQRRRTPSDGNSSPDPKWAYTKCMFNVYKNQQSWQTGSRNLMGQKTLPTIWDTYKIPTSCLPTLLIFIYIEHTFCICPFLLLYPRSPKGKGGILFYFCPSVRPRYFSSHFSQ